MKATLCALSLLAAPAAFAQDEVADMSDVKVTDARSASVSSLGGRKTWGIGTGLSIGAGGSGLAYSILPIEARFYLGRDERSLDLYWNWWALLSGAWSGVVALDVGAFYHHRWPVSGNISFAAGPGLGVQYLGGSGLSIANILVQGRVGLDFDYDIPVEFGLYLRPSIGIGFGNNFGFTGVFPAGGILLETTFVFNFKK